jgi:hypothetical protein
VARVGFLREASERGSRGPGPTDPLFPPQRAGASERDFGAHIPKPNSTPGKKPPAHRPPIDDNSLRAIATTVLEVFLAGT